MTTKWRRLPEKLVRNISVFRTVWQTVASQIPPWVYFYRTIRYHFKFRKKVSPTNFGEQLISPEQAEKLPDNSSDYKNFSYTYKGLNCVLNYISNGVPVAFVTWHHGAQIHAEYGISKKIPEIALFSRSVCQYGKVFSYSMDKAKALSLLKMKRFLQAGRPIHFHIDGAPLGETIKAKVLGVRADLSTGPIRIVKAINGIRIIPVTSYFRENCTIDIIFHCSFPETMDLPAMSTPEIIRYLIDFFEKDQINSAPEQVMWWFFVKRQLRLRDQKS